jgi:hypothetical protein
VEVVSYQGYRCDVFVGVADAGWVLAGVQDGAHAQSGCGGGVGDQVGDHLVPGQWSSSPVDRDLREESVAVRSSRNTSGMTNAAVYLRISLDAVNSD